MPNCAAYGCTSRSTRDKTLSFHQIPYTEARKEVRKQWLANIRRDGNLPKDSSLYICSKHFEPECFQVNLMVNILIKYTHTERHSSARYNITTISTSSNFGCIQRSKVLMFLIYIP